MLRIEGDRRRHPRVEVTQPCKICDPRSGRYIAGTTRDLSSHGLLIDLPRLIDLKPGDRLHVGVAMKRRQGLLLAKEMIEAKVVRAMPTIDDHTLLAVQFEHPVTLAAEIAMESLKLAA
jgi:hypothetical protein